MKQTNRYGFKVGDKFKGIRADDFRLDEIVTLHHDDGSSCPIFMNEEGYTSYEYYSYLKLIPEGTPVEIAKANFDKAQTAYETAVRVEQEAIKAAEAKAKEALKFTEADVKESFVVEHDSSHGGLRLVVLSNDGGVTFLGSKGKQTNSCSRKRLVDELNMMYKKTDKTLKDFCNA